MKLRGHPDNPWQRATQFGVDISLLIANLELTYEERAQRHAQALNLILQLKAAKREHDIATLPHPDPATLTSIHELQCIQNENK